MKHKLTLTFEDKMNTLQCGLRQHWLSGTRGKGARKETIDLACGAGVGQPWLIFTKTSNGQTKRMAADIRELVTQLDAIK